MKQTETDIHYERGYQDGYNRGYKECKNKYTTEIEKEYIRTKKLEKLLKFYLSSPNACLCDHCLSERIKLKEYHENL